MIRIITSFAVTFFVATIAYADAQLNNPLNPTFSSIPLFIAGALKVMVMVALPIISLFIVYSGFKFVMAQGKDEAITTAKNNLLYVIIGSILILGAWVIATLIGGTVSQLTTG
ncbi:MAG: hypothetical protein WC050_01045 [Candidatus Paceibacterota bacterium]